MKTPAALAYRPPIFRPGVEGTSHPRGDTRPSRSFRNENRRRRAEKKGRRFFAEVSQLAALKDREETTKMKCLASAGSVPQQVAALACLREWHGYYCAVCVCSSQRTQLRLVSHNLDTRSPARRRAPDNMTSATATRHGSMKLKHITCCGFNGFSALSGGLQRGDGRRDGRGDKGLGPLDSGR